MKVIKISFILFLLVFPFGIYASYGIETVVIDPGHGGKDPGAIDVTNPNSIEKEINYNIALYLKKLMEEKLSSIKIIQTRNGDIFVSLGDRTKIANQYAKKPSFFISIHTNSHNSKKKVKGVEVYYHYTSNSTIGDFRLGELKDKVVNDEKEGLIDPVSQIIDSKIKEDSKRLAENVAQGLKLASNEPIRRVAPSNLYVVSYSIIPAILVEVGFISSEKLLNSSYQQKIAKGIFVGILSYIRDTKKI